MRPANTPTVLSPIPHAKVTTPTQRVAQRPSPRQAGRQGGSHSSHSQEAEFLQALSSSPWLGVDKLSCQEHMQNPQVQAVPTGSSGSLKDLAKALVPSVLK